MGKIYAGTSKLKNAKFKGQKAFVVEALGKCSTPVALEDLIAIVDEGGRYYALLNDWARQNGGVKASVGYHLRELEKRGMINVTLRSEPTRVPIAGWGNSPAIRIPKAMLDELQVDQGDDVDLAVEDGLLIVRPVNPKLTLESLVAGITPENRHKQIDWGRPVGNEVW